MARKTKKAIDAEVDAAFRAEANGVQIPIMKLGSVLDAGRAAVLAGTDPRVAIRSALVAIGAVTP